MAAGVIGRDKIEAERSSLERLLELSCCDPSAGTPALTQIQLHFLPQTLIFISLIFSALPSYEAF